MKAEWMEKCLRSASENVDKNIVSHPDMTGTEIIMSYAFTAAALTLFIQQWGLTESFAEWMEAK